MTTVSETRLTWKDVLTPGDTLTAAESRRSDRLRNLIEGAAGQSITELFHADFNATGDAAKETVFWLEFIAGKLLTAAATVARQELKEERYFIHQRLLDDARGLASADAEETAGSWIG